jgi:hypothetical protein
MPFCVGLTSHKYLWLVTQSVIGDPEDRSTMRRSLPIGMIGDLNNNNFYVLELIIFNSKIFEIKIFRFALVQ